MRGHPIEENLELLAPLLLRMIRGGRGVTQGDTAGARSGARAGDETIFSTARGQNG